MVTKREEFRVIEASGKKWQISRFDALTGSYVVMTLLSAALPMGLDSQLSQAGGFSDLMAGRPLMDKPTFLDIQKECLKVVSLMKDLGGVETPLPVMLADGRWAIPEVEKDTAVVMVLTVAAILFNVEDFFLGDALKSLGDILSASSLFTASK